MADNLLMWGAVGVGAWLLLRGMGPKQPAAAAGSQGGGSPPANFLDQFGAAFAGLFAASGDEDIGVAPAPGIAAPGPAPGTKLVVQDGNTPVIAQTPKLIQQNVTLFGSQSTGFGLEGGENLTGSTQIKVAADSIVADHSFSTTPDVLSRYIDEVLFAGRDFDNPNIFDLGTAFNTRPAVRTLDPINTFAFSDE